MALAGWLRAIDVLIGMSDAARRIRGVPARAGDALPVPGQLGQLETRLAGVLVAALKEAFDRDSARLELERTQIEAERRRAESALRLELTRQAADRELGQLRFVGAISALVWVTSAVFSMRVAGGLSDALKGTLGGGWAFLLAALAAVFIAHRQVTKALGSGPIEPGRPIEIPLGGSASVAPWLLVAGLGLTSLALLLAI